MKISLPEIQLTRRVVFACLAAWLGLFTTRYGDEGLGTWLPGVLLVTFAILLSARRQEENAAPADPSRGIDETGSEHGHDRNNRLGREVERLVEAISQRDHALAQSHRRAQAYLDIVGVMVVMLNAKGNIVLVNRKAAEALACTPERQCQGLNWFEAFLAQEDRAPALAIFQRLLAGNQEAGEFYESRITTFTGQRRLIAWHNRVMRGRDGRVVGILCAGEDITESRQTQEALQHSEERLRLAQEAAGVGVWELDIHTHKLTWSPECARLYDVTPDSIQHYEDWLRLLYPEDRARIEAQSAALISLGGAFELEFRTSGKTDKPRWIFAKGRTVPDASGRVGHIVGINIDITERKRMQEEQMRLQAHLQQAQKMESLGQLTGGIAHDFNNILASVLGFARLALRRHAPDKTGELAEFLHEIIIAGERARDLVMKMLAFGRAQPGAGSTPLAPAPLAKEALKMLSAAIPASIRIDTRFEETLPDIALDPVAFHQILVNLVINARDAIGEKGLITLALTTKQTTDQSCSACHERFSGQYVELLVTDTGHGISAENMPRIFEPFFTTKGVGMGSGMGLAMVHGLVRGAGGHFLVESLPGQGASFHVFLPLADTPPPPAQSAEQQPPSCAATGSKGHVLIVDDEIAILRLLAATLTAEGWEVSAFERPQDALTAFQSRPEIFDAAITDQAMPEMTGIELIQSLHALRPGIPVLLCTGYSERLDKSSALQLGASHFFMKPVDSDTLIAALDALVGQTKEISAS